jgi:hypothetical protein
MPRSADHAPEEEAPAVEEIPPRPEGLELPARGDLDSPRQTLGADGDLLAARRIAREDGACLIADARRLEPSQELGEDEARVRAEAGDATRVASLVAEHDEVGLAVAR